jgi:GDP-L-fucose synthase
VAVPPTVYGPGSDTDLETAHVIGALIAKFSRAVHNNDTKVELWGSGKPRREFLYTDDFVSGSLFLMKHYDKPDIVNLGAGHDVTVKELAGVIAKVSGFKGKVIFDASKPDGTMRKLMDNARITRMGWKAKVPLEEGIRRTVQWYVSKNEGR